MEITKKRLKIAGYTKALERVIDTRIGRASVYGDQWKDEDDWVLLALIVMKCKRLKQFVMDKIPLAKKENKIDTLIDLANYTLFLLNNELEAEEK